MHAVFQDTHLPMAFSVQDDKRRAGWGLRMIRLLLSRTIGRISTRSFFAVWIRASGAMLFLWVATLTAADSWIAQTGLTFVLIILLVGGIVLFVLGIRDLIRDFRRFLRLRSERKSDA
jgi:hypothetical protein